MSAQAPTAEPATRAPWHLRVVGTVTLLWNASGAYTIMMAQAGRASLTEDEAAYYAAQPLWFVVVTDVALLSAIAAAIALLLRHRAAVRLFALSIVAIVTTNIYDLASGTAQMLSSTAALVVTTFILLIAVLELVYARVMKRRSVLR